MKRHFQLNPIFSAMIGASLLGGLVAEAVARPTLEEVIVTAQKREESLQDVPISVSAISGEKIAEAGIQRMEDVTAYIPNFIISPEAVSDRIVIRGIQSGTQAGFEQSVATFVDGIYRGRSVQSRFSFLDVGTVEVLRGPQGTLFGKNTIAGAMNIRSARPTDEFEGSIRAAYNVDFEETEFTGYISGGLADNLRGRFAFVARQMDEGWVNNSFYDEDSPDTDEWAGRISLEWDVSDETLVKLKYEHGEWDNVGQPWEIVEAGPLAAIGVEGDVNMRSNIGDTDPIQDVGSLMTFEGDLDEFALNVEHTIGDHTLTAIAGYSTYDFERFQDADYNPLSVVRFDDTEDFEQTSFEFRIASDTGGAVEYIGGFYYQDNEMETDGLTYLNLPTTYGLVAGGCAAAGGAFASGDVPTTLGLNAGLSAAAAFSCANQAALDPSLLAGVPGANRYLRLDQETESWAIFGQITFNITDEFRATVGIRYTEEEKEASQSAVAADYAVRGTTPTSDAGVRGVALSVLEFTEHDFDNLGRDEESFTWSGNLQYDLTPEIMTYLTVSTGFKAGGFNSFYTGQSLGAGANPDDVDFEEEEVLSAEIGAKMSLLDGAAELNIAAFYTEYDDLQVAVFTGATTFEVQNAAEAISQGIEIDGRWQATENLMLSGSLGWVDFEFDSFPNQACTNAQFEAFREAAWAGGTNLFGAFANAANCAAAGINDLEGESTPHTPEYSATLSASYEQEVGDFLWGITTDIIWIDETFRSDDLDPVLKQDDQTTVNASLRFGSAEGDWMFSIIGKNLTDEDDYVYYGNDVPLFGGAFFGGVSAPRSITVAATLKF